jgi:hypothetical protein
MGIGPTLVFFEFMLVALVWLFLMLSWLWPNAPAARYPTRPNPAHSVSAASVGFSAQKITCPPAEVPRVLCIQEGTPERHGFHAAR